MNRLALGHLLGQFGELMDTQSDGMFQGDGSSPYGAFVWRQEFFYRNDLSPMSNVPYLCLSTTPE